MSNTSEREGRDTGLITSHPFPVHLTSQPLATTLIVEQSTYPTRPAAFQDCGDLNGMNSMKCLGVDSIVKCEAVEWSGSRRLGGGGRVRGL